MCAYLRTVAEFTRSGDISVAMILRGDRHSWSSGPASASTDPVRFQIGCVTKILVAAVVLELDEAGLIDIDLPIGRYLPEFDGAIPGQQVLVRHLLSDSAGYLGVSTLSERTFEMDWDDLVGLLSNGPQIFAPGTVCSLDYSSYVLVGEIIRRTCGRPWTRLVDDLIGMPLFGRSLFEGGGEDERLWSTVAATALLSVEELASLGEVLLHGKCGTSGRVILSERSASRLREAVVFVPERAGGQFLHCLPIGHGLGMSRFHSGVSGECGRGRQNLASIRFVESIGAIFAICISSLNTFGKFTVIDGILSELGIPVPAKPDRISMDLSPDAISGEYVGIRDARVSVDVNGAQVGVTVLAGDGSPTKCQGTLNGDNTFSMDAKQPVPGFGFFPDPCTGLPSLMLGVYALRKVS
jgi:hypothetical protein